MPGFLLPLIAGGLGILGGAGRGMSQERGNANDFAQRENDRKSRDYSTQQQALLQLLGLVEQATRDRADRALMTPKTRAQQSLLGSLMANYQPLQISGLPSHIKVPQTTGGLAAAINPAARQGGRMLQGNALRALATGSDVPAMPDTSKGIAPSPVYGGYQKAGLLEKLLGGAGVAGGLVGAFQQARGASGPSGGGARNRAVFGG